MASPNFDKRVPLDDIRRSHGRRRRFRGAMVHPHGGPRSHHIDHQLAKVSHECGQTQAYQTKTIPGRFKVQLPKGRIRYVKAP